MEKILSLIVDYAPAIIAVIGVSGIASDKVLKKYAVAVSKGMRGYIGRKLTDFIIRKLNVFADAMDEDNKQQKVKAGEIDKIKDSL